MYENGAPNGEIEPTMFLSSPDKPEKPDGCIQGNSGVEYTYKTSTEDLNEDGIYYLWDWGDGTNSGWKGPFASGEEAEAKHKWAKEGSYHITVKARDEYDYGSEWADQLSIRMDNSRGDQIINCSLIYRLLYRVINNYSSTSLIVEHLLDM